VLRGCLRHRCDYACLLLARRSGQIGVDQELSGRSWRTAHVTSARGFVQRLEIEAP